MQSRGHLRPPAWCRSLAGGLLLALSACYDGVGELEPAPGAPGGLCLEPANTCDQPFWPCDPVGGFCYDAAAPCRGVLCNGHGVCEVDEKRMLPVCKCEPGYGNFEYTLYCESL